MLIKKYTVYFRNYFISVPALIFWNIIYSYSEYEQGTYVASTALLSICKHSTKDEPPLTLLRNLLWNLFMDFEKNLYVVLKADTWLVFFNKSTIIELGTGLLPLFTAFQLSPLQWKSVILEDQQVKTWKSYLSFLCSKALWVLEYGPNLLQD